VAENREAIVKATPSPQRNDVLAFGAASFGTNQGFISHEAAVYLRNTPTNSSMTFTCSDAFFES